MESQMQVKAPVAGRNVPISNRDFDFFYRGLKDGHLLVQRCAACGVLRNPPGPACPNCQSFSWTPLRLSGRGTLYSYTVHYHPPLPGFSTPLPVGLATMEEGIRMLGAMDAAPASDLAIGMAIETEFLWRDGVRGFRFHRASAGFGPSE
jgi:uncharacterized OB-fold protein